MHTSRVGYVSLESKHAGEGQAGTRVYVSNAESKDIYVFDMSRKSGVFAERERVAVPGTDIPSPTSLPMAISPDRRFLYAALRSQPFPVSSYAIDPSTGQLTLIASVPLVASRDSAAIVVALRVNAKLSSGMASVKCLAIL